MALGTSGYAPPEQFGYSQTDVRSDIYSLGVVMRELLVEQDEEKLLQGQTKPDQSASHSEERSEQPNMSGGNTAAGNDGSGHLSPDICRVIERATMFASENRYNSIDEMMDALKNPQNTGISQKQGKQGSRRILLFAAGVAMVAVIFTGVLLWQLTRSDDESIYTETLTSDL